VDSTAAAASVTGPCAGKRDHREHRRAQAGRVFFWTETDCYVTDIEGPDTREAVTVYIKNTSEQS
jgi:hypothetical protein